MTIRYSFLYFRVMSRDYKFHNPSTTYFVIYGVNDISREEVLLKFLKEEL